MKPLLSILVPTVPRRVGTMFPNLIKKLESQITVKEQVEILGLYDNKFRLIGDKRNCLLDMAQGCFVVFLDDDDDVCDDYLATLLPILQVFHEADVVTYLQQCTINGCHPKICHYGLQYDYQDFGATWYGKPAHTMPWRADIAKATKFPSKKWEEDMDWVAEISKKASRRRQYTIQKVMYFYRMDTGISETR